MKQRLVATGSDCDGPGKGAVIVVIVVIITVIIIIIITMILTITVIVIVVIVVIIVSSMVVIIIRSLLGLAFTFAGGQPSASSSPLHDPARTMAPDPLNQSFEQPVGPLPPCVQSRL